MYAIETFGLTKRFKNKLAVDNISFQVAEGGCYGFLGPNGAGKSTCMKLMTGLIFPTAGGGTVLGKPFGDAEARVQIGYLPELFRFQPWMTGFELLHYHTQLYRLPRNQERVDWALKLVGLTGAGGYKVGTYSKGMQQRIGLAAAMLPNPKLLFLDEPSSALDPIGRKDMRELIAGLKSHGVTIFLNSHLLAEVETICDHLTIINQGRIAFSGTMADALNRPNLYELRVGALNDAQASALAQRLGGVPTFDHEGRFSASLHNDDELAALIAWLVSQDIAVYQATKQRAGLEDMFIQLIQQTSQPNGGVAV